MSDRLLRRRQVEEITGMGRSSIYRLMQHGDFPPPVRVGPAAVRWRESDITGWLGVTAAGEKPVRPAQRSLDNAWLTAGASNADRRSESRG